MKKYHYTHLLKTKEKKHTKTILSIGVFEGVHIAHQNILKRMSQIKSEHKDYETTLITFSKNPKYDTLAVDTLRLREEYVSSFNIDNFVVLDFFPEISKLNGVEFMKGLLSSFDLVYLVEGDDFQIGNPSLPLNSSNISSFFEKYKKNVNVIIEETIFSEGGDRVSSTLLRRVIENGYTKCFSVLTGRDYRIDLLNLIFSIDSNSLVYSKTQFLQVLPPLGVYNAKVSFTDGESMSLKVEITKDDVIIYIGCYILEGVKNKERVLESYYFMEKENGFK